MPGKGHVVALLTCCVLLCASVEGLTFYLFGRMSHVQNRRETEYRQALSVRSARDRHATSVLVVGNSLLLEAVDFPQLQRQSGSAVELSRAAVENTFYLDWYYGLRRMFKMGARPDLVVLMLNPVQFTSKATDGDYSAHFLVDREDIPRLAQDIGADRNEGSSLELANLSFFYGSRAEIRTWILGKLLPDLPRLTRLFHPVSTGRDVRAVGEVAAQRFTQLHLLGEQYCVDVVVVIPPATEDSGAGAVLQAAAASKVRVLVPIAPGTLPLSDYADSFHLNSRGAEKFTPALVAGLRQVLLEIARDQPDKASPSSIASAPGLSSVVSKSTENSR